MHAHQGTLSLDFVPNILREHGLSDAHPYPLVSAGKRPGQPFTSFRVEAEAAWDWAEVEYGRTPTSYAAVLVDLDGHDSADRLDGAVLARAVQPPAWTVRRPSSGGVHAVWPLKNPVHRYPRARQGPLDLFARVSEWYVIELRGDPGYAGVLAHNPTANIYDARYLHRGGWSLEELADPIPVGWRRPTGIKLVSAVGRNVSLFRALCRFAGRLSHTFYAIDAEADRLNGEFVVPLDANEVRDILRSVHRYRAAWQARGHQPAFIERQRARGRASGRARFQGSAEQRRPWDADGVSRRTWYRRRRAVALEPTPLDRRPMAALLIQTGVTEVTDDERYGIINDIRDRLQAHPLGLSAAVKVWADAESISTPIGVLVRGQVPTAFLAAWKERQEALTESAAGQLSDWFDERPLQENQ